MKRYMHLLRDRPKLAVAIVLLVWIIAGIGVASDETLGGIGDWMIFWFVSFAILIGLLLRMFFRASRDYRGRDTSEKESFDSRK